MPRSVRSVVAGLRRAWEAARPGAAGVAVAAILLLGCSVAPSQVNGVAGVEHYFRVTWERQVGRRGPVVSGHVHNNYGYAAADVQIEVAGLDAAGAVVSRIYARVLGTVPPLGDAYFEVPVAPGAASCRVTVVSFQPFGRGAGS